MALPPTRREHRIPTPEREHVSRDDRERARVIDFRQAVELFEPQKADRPGLAGNTPAAPGRPLPWEPGHPVRRRPAPRTRVWRHTVYLGVFRTEQMHTILTDSGLADRVGTAAEALHGRPFADVPHAMSR